MFIDARRMGRLIDRKHRELSDEELDSIAGTYHRWRGDRGAESYEDIPGFCKSASLDLVREHDFGLTPGRYVGAEDIEDDDEPFEQKVKRLTKTLEEQFVDSEKLEKAIRESLRSIGYGI